MRLTLYLPTHLPSDNPQHLIRTASFSSTFSTTHQPTHPPPQQGYFLAFNFQVSHVSTECDYPLGEEERLKQEKEGKISDEW